MNKNILEGNWKQLKGNVQVQWGKLTDDDLDVIEGRREIMAGKIKERYRISKEEAEEQVKQWKNKHYIEYYTFTNFYHKIAFR